MDKDCKLLPLNLPASGMPIPVSGVFSLVFPVKMDEIPLNVNQ
jgi:hypothetical protein